MNITFTATCSSYLVLYLEKCERILYWIVGLCKLLMTWFCSLLLSHISYNDFRVITHDSHKILEWDLGIGVKPAVSSLSHIQESLKYSFFLPDLAIDCFILQKKLRPSQKEWDLPSCKVPKYFFPIRPLWLSVLSVWEANKWLWILIFMLSAKKNLPSAH